MAYATVPTVATGDSWSAAQHNTYIKNNFAALWPYTTIGDIAYASTGTTLTRLGIGSEGKVLTVNSGLPSWQTMPNNKSALIKRAASQSISKNTYTKVTFDTETYDNNSFWTAGDPTKISFVTAGYYRIDGNFSWADNNGDDRRVIFTSSTPTTGDDAATSGGFPAVMSFSYYYHSAGSDFFYCWVYQSAVTTLNLTNCQIYISYLGT